MNIITKADKKRRRVAAIGMWDGVHRGHRFLIDYLLLEGQNRGLTPAVVTFSDHPRRLVDPERAPRLLSTLDDRMEALGRAGIEDVILLSFNERMRRQSARKFLERLKKSFGIDTLVVGFNNRFGRDCTDGLNEYKVVGQEIGLDVVGAPEFKGVGNKAVSSSIVRQRLAEGHVEEAAEMLGRPFELLGTVVEGIRLGRTLGFPTANLRLAADYLIVPGNGVYACFVTTPDGVRRPAVVNVGYRPTVDNTDTDTPALSVEIHIPDFSGYLYDDELNVEFISRLRDEKQFKNTDMLARAIAADIKKALKILR